MTPMGALVWMAVGTAGIGLACMVTVLVAGTFRTLNQQRRSNNETQDGEHP